MFHGFKSIFSSKSSEEDLGFDSVSEGSSLSSQGDYVVVHSRQGSCQYVNRMKVGASARGKSCSCMVQLGLKHH